MILVGAASGATAYATYSATTSNPGDSFSSGSVTISDNDAGAAMFVNVTGLKPGTSQYGCIGVTYTGSLSANVRMYATVGGTGLGPYLNLTVYRGQNTAGFNSCVVPTLTFTADTTVYVTGQPAGVIYNGTLSNYPSSSAAGIVDPTSSSPELWTTNEVHWYLFVLSLQNNSAAQGLNATIAFTWEAQNT